MIWETIWLYKYQKYIMDIGSMIYLVVIPNQ